jgi:hypothetical protein
MQEIWFNGTNGAKEDREKVKQDLALADKAFKRMKEILVKKRKSNTSTDYDKASWPFYQADNNGYNRALQEVLNLIGD